MSNKTYVGGQIIVAFKTTTSKDEADALIAKLGLGLILWSIRAHRAIVAVPDGQEQEWVAKFAQLPEVEVAQLRNINVTS